MESQKFTQVSIPCKDCLVKAACKDKPRLSEDIFAFMLVMKKWDEKQKVYRKGLIECWANMGWDIFSSMRSSEFDEIPKNLAPQFVDVLIELSSLIQWIIHSTSWQKGEKFDFDIAEIKRKIEKAKGWV